MSQMNPVTGSILQTSVMQKQQADVKTQQMRRTEDLRKNAAATEDDNEHQVESSEELTPMDDDHSNGRNPKKRGDGKHKPDEEVDDEGKSHIDMKA
jgi:hypothetical protein